MESAIQGLENVDDLLGEILSLHFDPRFGAPYWLEQIPRLGFDPRDAVRCVDDLPLLGLMNADSILRRPLLDLVPRDLTRNPAQLVLGQTGGTLGHPIWTAYSKEDFHAAFVSPFLVAAAHVDFPRNGSWLYAGPSGPHIIGRAAEAIAMATGGHPPFTIDFDPRWLRKLEVESFAAKRYLTHVVDQAIAIFETQQVDIIFSMPGVLKRLGEKLDKNHRHRIRGIHYGGMTLDPEDLLHFQRDAFPSAVHLSGYGNTLFGCCPELNSQPGRELCYYPFGARVLFGVLEGESDGATLRYNCPGREGRLVFSRLDRSMLLANFVERDSIRLISPPCNAPTEFVHHGLRSPVPAGGAIPRESAAVY
jgi:thienamycin biosynthesis protein ThnN